MDKKYLINVTRSMILELNSEKEARAFAEILADREEKKFVNNTVFITTDVEELVNA